MGSAKNLYHLKTDIQSDLVICGILIFDFVYMQLKIVLSSNLVILGLFIYEFVMRDYFFGPCLFNLAWPSSIS